MPRYRSDFTEHDYDRVKTVVLELAAAGPFDANDVLFRVLQVGATNNAGDVASLLGDLVDLGHLEQIGVGLEGPHRFILASDQTDR